MKKIAVVILAFLYIITTTGANLNMHYCMGELADWGFGSDKSKTCGFCGMEKGDENDNGCCKDEQKFVKNDADQKFVDTSSERIKVITAAQIPAFTEVPADFFTSNLEQNPVSNAPPRSKGLALYKLHNTFLI